jgi:hypothetical protein
MMRVVRRPRKHFLLEKKTQKTFPRLRAAPLNPLTRFTKAKVFVSF